MYKLKDPNPLNIFNVRRTSVAPPHYEYIDLPLRYNLEDSLVKWIERNLKKRYYVGKNVSLDNDNKIINTMTIGFEESKDMSYFMLACPHLKYN